ncbi:MAG: alpha/beta fold hydrolase, partial [Deltaproteobacteria bacterium]
GKIMQTEVRELTLNIGALQLAMKCWGKAEDKPILALHGWLDNAASFDRLAPLLTGYQIYAVDMPGHGLSSHWPQGMSYHSIDAVGVVSQWIHHWNFKKITLLGHSMGASIASLYASAFPEFVDKLVLIEGLGPLASPAEDAPTRLRRSILQYAELPHKKMPVYPSIEQAIEIRRKVSGMSVEATTPIVNRGIKKTEGGFTWRTDPRLKMESPYRMTEDQVCACLKKIECPVLWIRANQGMNLDPFMASHRQESVKQLQVFRLDGNHHVHLEEPAPVAKAILSFL